MKTEAFVHQGSGLGEGGEGAGRNECDRGPLPRQGFSWIASLRGGRVTRGLLNLNLGVALDKPPPPPALDPLLPP